LLYLATGAVMKAKYLFNKILILFVIILISSCNETELNNTELQTISYLSYKSNGCLSHNNLLKTNDETILSFEYSGGKLKTFAPFYCQCAASFKDSVSIYENTINIFLADTSLAIADCLCPYKEEFSFEIGDVKEINVLFCLNDTVLADTLLKLY
jgi:hypothetical protein